MDLSIKDLMMKTERPTGGLRALAAQVPVNGAGPNANAAFNDLLKTFHADRPEAPAVDRGKPDYTRPVRSDSASERRQNDKRSSDSSEIAVPRDSRAPRAKETDNVSSVEVAAEQTGADVQGRNETGNTGIQAAAFGDTPSDTADENVVPGVVQGAPVQPPLNKGETTPATAQAQSLHPAQNGTATATPKADGKNATPPAANADIATNAEANVKPSLFRDLGTAGGAQASSGPGDEVLAQLAGALNKPAANPATKSGLTGLPHAETAVAQNAAPRPHVNDPLPRLGEAFATLSLEGDAPDAQPLRQPMTPGLLALQEVGMNTAATSNANAHGTASGIPATNPTQTVAANPTLPTQGTADGVVPLAGVSSAAAEPQAPAATLRAGNPAQQNIIGGPLNSVGTPGNVASANASAQQATRTPPSIPVALNDVAVHIARAASTGVDHINIKLKPAALGEVEVKLEMTHDGRVAAVVTADRSDTLDMLARDAKSLERALADAGLKTDQGSLQFNLRGEGGNAQGDDNDGSLRPYDDAPSADASAENLKDGAIAGYANTRAALGGVDIRV